MPFFELEIIISCNICHSVGDATCETLNILGQPSIWYSIFTHGTLHRLFLTFVLNLLEYGTILALVVYHLRGSVITYNVFIRPRDQLLSKFESAQHKRLISLDRITINNVRMHLFNFTVTSTQNYDLKI